jgi:hypothetical protein
MQMAMDIALITIQAAFMDWYMRQDIVIQVMTTPDIIKIFSVITQLKNIMVASNQNFPAI